MKIAFCHDNVLPSLNLKMKARSDLQFRAAALDLACRGTPSVRVGSVVIRHTPPPDASSSQQPQIGWVD